MIRMFIVGYVFTAQVVLDGNRLRFNGKRGIWQRAPYSLPSRARERRAPIPASSVSRPTRAIWLSRLGGAAAAE